MKQDDGIEDNEVMLSSFGKMLRRHLSKEAISGPKTE